jgi:hypothetical protein
METFVGPTRICGSSDKARAEFNIDRSAESTETPQWTPLRGSGALNIHVLMHTIIFKPKSGNYGHAMRQLNNFCKSQD